MIDRLSSLRIMHKGLLLVAVPLAFELIFVFTLVGLLQKADYEAWREAHAREVIAQLNALNQHFYQAGASLASYGATRNELFAKQYHRQTEAIPDQLRLIERLLAEDPDQKASVEKLNKVADAALRLLSQAHAAVEQSAESSGPLKGMAAAGLISGKSNVEATLGELMLQLNQFVREQNRIEAVEIGAQSRARSLVVQWLFAGVVLNVVLAAALLSYFSKDIGRRLTVLVDNTSRLARNLPLHKPVGGTDELAHLDRVFHEMASCIEESNRKRQELLCMVSHDLRSPLTAVGMSIKMLTGGMLGPVSADALSEMELAEHNTSRLIKMVNQLLDVEKIAAGKLEIDVSPTSLLAIVERSSQAVAALASHKQIRVQRAVDESFMVLADQDRILQVLINLLSNAIKFSPESSTVTIEAFAAGPDIEIAVIDSGPGVPDDFKEHLFTRFEQLEPSEQESSGLGLFICKQIIELHGGTIGVDANGKQGSRFWFRLRRTDEERAGKPNAALRT